MSSRPRRTLLFEEPITFGASLADAAPGADPTLLPLSSYQEVTPPRVIRCGLALRASPGRRRFCVVPLGGRVLSGPAGLFDEEHPFFFEPSEEPTRIGVLGTEPPLEVDILAPASGERRILVWTRTELAPIPLPELPEEIDLAEPLARAAGRAGDAGGLGGLVVAGLVLRFASPSLLDVIQGTKPIEGWMEDYVDSLDEDQAEAASGLACTMAMQWARSWRRLDETMAPEDPAWLAELWETLRLRDDLASATRVLRRLDQRGGPDTILAQADAEAATWLRGLPFVLHLDDPHLAEVARREDPFWARRAWLPEP